MQILKRELKITTHSGDAGDKDMIYLLGYDGYIKERIEEVKKTYQTLNKGAISFFTWAEGDAYKRGWNKALDTVIEELLK
jgi:hypothetical protein